MKQYLPHNCNSRLGLIIIKVNNRHKRFLTVTCCMHVSKRWVMLLVMMLLGDDGMTARTVHNRHRFFQHNIDTTRQTIEELR